MIKILLLLTTFFSLSARAAEDKIPWQTWTDHLFEQAKKEKKLVILDLEAVWCHWCHVMEEKTYSDKGVIELIRKNYIAVRVDQDARPDLSQRYEDYGWPATIIFDSNGKELAKRSGFIEPKNMNAMLQAFIDDPTPGPSANGPAVVESMGTSQIDKVILDTLKKLHAELYDDKQGGWGTIHKFLYTTNLEYAIRQARKGDTTEETRAKTSLKLNYKLQDPAWGGVYQYSVGGWDEPHFEKIMSMQTGNILAYTLAYRLWKDPQHLKTAESIYKYLTTFLLDPNGGFYVSQDADLIPGKHSDDYFKLGDKQRRKKGIPRVDKHQYARENGWVIEALCQLYASTSEEKYLKTAKKAAEWMIANRSTPEGTFRHDEKDVAGPYLGDTLGAGRAFLALHEVTADREWLTKSIAAAKALDKAFRIPAGGFTAAKGSASVPARAQREENAQLARYANLLHHFTGDNAFKEIAEHSMKFLSSKAVVQVRPTTPQLLAAEEINEAPLHVTVVGAKNDPSAKELFLSAIKYPETYLRIEWWDKAEGPLARMDVNYPQLAKAAAFICTGTRCSLPVFAGKEIASRIEKIQMN